MLSSRALEKESSTWLYPRSHINHYTCLRVAVFLMNKPIYCLRTEIAFIDIYMYSQILKMVLLRIR